MRLTCGEVESYTVIEVSTTRCCVLYSSSILKEDCTYIIQGTLHKDGNTYGIRQLEKLNQHYT